MQCLLLIIYPCRSLFLNNACSLIIIFNQNNFPSLLQQHLFSSAVIQQDNPFQKDNNLIPPCIFPVPEAVLLIYMDFSFKLGIVCTHWGRWWTLWSLWARLCCGPADGRRAGPGHRCVCRRPRGRAAQTALWTAPDRCGTAPGTAGSGRAGSWGYWCCPSNSWSDAQSEGHKPCTGHDTHVIHSMDV